MLDQAQRGFRTTELDPELLATPFKRQTDWHVITGAPCCGKTTLIGLLADRGFQTVPEVGREYIEREMAKGRTIDEIRESEVDFCYRIRDVTLERESALRAKERFFLDRALPDCLTFYRLAGLDPNQVLPQCFHHQYASVFVLDRFPFQLDGVRIEGDAASGFADEWLPRDYGALGYSIVRVPVLSPGERLTFVLQTLSEQGLI
jgi:predicted ATPase